MVIDITGSSAAAARAHASARRSPRTGVAGARPAGRCRHGPARGLTLIELLVAVALVSGVILIVASVFSTASQASGRTVAHTELLDSAGTLERTLRNDLANVAPGFMLLFAPNADRSLAAVPPDLDINPPLNDMPDVAPLRPSEQNFNTPLNPVRAVRADMLSFISSGPVHQSHWVYVRNLATNQYTPLTRPDALITYGHGVSAADTNTPRRLPQVDAFSLDLCRRAILLGCPADTTNTRVLPSQPGPITAAQPLNPDGFHPFFNEGRLDASTTVASAIVQYVRNLPLANVPAAPGNNGLPAFSNPGAVNGIRPWIWPEVVDPNSLAPDGNYFRRHAFRLMPHVGSVTIEWTDGSLVDPRYNTQAAGFVPGNPAIQWFGQPRDANGDGDIVASDRRGNGQLVANNLTNQNLLQADADDVITQSQWAQRLQASNYPAIDHGIDGLDGGGNYYALWTERNWHRRPKALRFIVRLYDQNQRISNVEPWPPQAVNAAPLHEKRYGLEFTLVVPVP